MLVNDKCGNNSNSIRVKRKKAKVAFLICYDVLVDVFNFFDRRQLAKLEEVCDRFNSVVERFNERPFLILELQCRAKVDYDIFNKVLSDPQDIKCGHRSTSGRKTSSVSLIRPNLEVGKKCTIFKPSAKIGSISSFVRINTIYIDCLKTSTASTIFLSNLPSLRLHRR